MSMKRVFRNQVQTKPESDPQSRAKLSAFWYGLAILAVGFIAWVVYLGTTLPSFDQLENYNPELATKVYSADSVLIKEFFTERRFYTPISQIPQPMIKAVMAIEDHRFYDHWGLAPLRFLAAVISDMLTMSRQQGASTLTQQLARRLYLSPEKTVARKIREMLTAIQLERTYTKQEIIEMYLNHMAFAHGSYGVEAAAWMVYNKKIQDCTLAECALLAGMAQRPAYLHPYRHPDRALKRRNLVLARMLDERYITRAQYGEAVNTPLTLAPANERKDLGIAPYFTENIRQELQRQFGWDLYKAGLRIYTTLDTRVQACAERAVANYLPHDQEVSNRAHRTREDLEKLAPKAMIEEHGLEKIIYKKALADSVLNDKAAVQVAVVALDPRNGHILAMIGGRDFEESKYNRAIQAVRQPGSIFKPIVATAAVDNGYMPCYEKLNQPIVVQQADGSRWTPSNYDGSIGGKTTLREALRRSLNLVMARLVQEDVPPQQVVQYARSLGITTPLDAVDAIALGSTGVKPLEITSAFGVFANHGVLVTPISILRVEDKFGNVLNTTSPTSRGVLREETAYIITDMLKTVARHGTGAASVSQFGFQRPAGGKTGTTNGYTDAWYITFTPQMVVNTWVGHDDPSMYLGEKQTGSNAALPITVPIIKCAMDTLGLPVEEFVRPEGVVELDICNETKLLAGKYCPDVVTEIFDVRYQPQGECQIHKSPRSTTRDSNKGKQTKKKIQY
jgi:penicillin-binding protein 1A